MCNFIIIFILLYMLCSMYNVTIVKHLHKGYYLYYEVKEFNLRYLQYYPKVKRVLLWKFKDSEEEDIY